MSSFRNHIRLYQVALQLVLLLLVAVAGERAVAQYEDNGFHVRVGEGSSITTHGSRSVFLSLPKRRLAGGDTSPVVFVDQNVALCEERNRLDFIMGVAPMVQLELAHDIPRLTIEGGIGVNIVSSREMDGRQLGSNFLFSPTVSAGIELPWMKGLLGVFYMFRHLSNAGMFRDNDGVNFQYIVFSMSFKTY